MKLYNNRFKIQHSRNNVLSREDNYKACAILYGYLNESRGLLSKSSSYVDIDRIQKTHELNRFYGLAPPTLSNNGVSISNTLLQDKRETTMNTNNDIPVITMTNHNMPRKGSLYNNMVKEVNEVKKPLTNNSINNNHESIIKINYNSALLPNNNMLQRLTVNNINPLEQLPVSIAEESTIKVNYNNNNKKNKVKKEIIKEKPKIVVKPIKSKKQILPKRYTQDSDEENITDESDVDTVDMLSDRWSDSEGSD